MNKLTITTREEAGISEEAVFALIKEAYRQLADNGLDASFLHFTLEDFKTFVRDAIIFVAVDTETGELLGTHTLLPKREGNFINDRFLAVSPNAKRTGIASRMLQVEEEYVRQEGFDYFLDSTAIPAVWSVKWHRKNGYRIVGYYRRSPHFAHYVFRKQLSPSFFWSGPLAPITAYCHFLVSYIATRLTKTSAGKLSLIGRMTRKVVRAVKRK